MSVSEEINTPALPSEYRFITSDDHTYLIRSDEMGTRIYTGTRYIEADIPALSMGRVYFIDADDVQRLRVVHRSGYIAVLMPYNKTMLGLCYHKTSNNRIWDKTTSVAYTEQPDLTKHAVISRNHGLHWTITAPITRLVKYTKSTGQTI